MLCGHNAVGLFVNTELQKHCDPMATSAADSNDLTVPKWFLYLASAFMVGALPWGIFVTNSVYQIQSLVKTVDETRLEVHKNSSEIKTHMLEPDIHRGAINMLSVRYEEIIRRLDKIDHKLEGGNLGAK